LIRDAVVLSVSFKSKVERGNKKNQFWIKEI